MACYNYGWKASALNGHQGHLCFKCKYSKEDVNRHKECKMCLGAKLNNRHGECRFVPMGTANEKEK